MLFRCVIISARQSISGRVLHFPHYLQNLFIAISSSSSSSFGPLSKNSYSLSSPYSYIHINIYVCVCTYIVVTQNNIMDYRTLNINYLLRARARAHILVNMSAREERDCIYNPSAALDVILFCMNYIARTMTKRQKRLNNSSYSSSFSVQGVLECRRTGRATKTFGITWTLPRNHYTRFPFFASCLIVFLLHRSR